MLISGFLALAAIIVGFAVSIHNDFLWSSVLTHVRQYMTAYLALNIVVALLLYIRSFTLPKSSLYAKGNTGYYVADLATGREMFPTIRGFDVKLFLFRLLICMEVS